MITDSQKAQAMAQIRRQVPLEQIATELMIPPALIKEWAKTSGHDLIAVEANLHAVEHILTEGGVVESNTDRLKVKLEEAALELVKELPMSHGDPMYAKSIQLCADTINKLYTTFFKTNEPAENPDNFNPSAITAFASLMKD